MFLNLGKRVLKIIGITIGSIVLLLAVFYWWFVNNAEKAIQEMVAIQSNGKLQVHIGKMRYNYGKRLALYNVDFINNDSLEVNSSYRFHINELHLKTNSLSSLIRERQLLIDSILIKSPAIIITRLQKKERKPVSLPEELGKIYESIHKALNVLQVRRFDIENATVTLIDGTVPDPRPLTISRLNFHIDNFMVDTTAHGRREKFLFSDNVVLHTDHQQILLPDGRHRISFRNFRINIAQKLVEMDSCTIRALNRAGDKAIFRTHLDTLKLTNVDFLALSRRGLLKADSMYCVNPVIRLDLPLDSMTRRNKNPLDINQLLRHMAADMQFQYIGVKNADVAVTTTKNEVSNQFTSSGNNFELFHFAIDTKADKPVSIERFLMAIRNYEGYGEDSAYRFRFDSINFNNDRIQLNNFSITTSPHARVHANRNYHVPLFELEGLSWPELIFNKHIKAEQAILHQPVLRYSKAVQQEAAPPGGRKTIYEVFEILDTLMTLDRISIIDGTLDAWLNATTHLSMQHVSGTVNTNRLLQATSAQYIENSVNGLSFSKAVLQSGELHLQVNEAHFDGSSQSLLVRGVALQNKTQTISATADNIALKGLQINDSSNLIRIDNISWRQARVQVQLPEKRTADTATVSSSTPGLYIDGLKGANTALELVAGKRTISTFLTQVSASTIEQHPGRPMQLQGLHLAGNQLQVKDETSLLQLASYQLTDRESSVLHGLRYEKTAGRDTISLAVPTIHLLPDIARTAEGHFTASELVAEQPQLRIVSSAKEPGQSGHSPRELLPWLQIDRLDIRQPVLQWVHHNDSEGFFLNLNGEGAGKNDHITFTNIRTITQPHRQIRISNIHLSGSGLRWQQVGETGDRITLRSPGFDLENISFSREQGEAEWTALVKQLDIGELQRRRQGKKRSSLLTASGRFNNIQLSSAWLHHLSAIASHSPHLQVQDLWGRYQDSSNHFAWSGVQFDAQQQLLSLDSFAYSPASDRDAFIAAHPFQTDYIRLHTGRIRLYGFNPAVYLRDSLLQAERIIIEEPAIHVYRDKRPPFKAGIIKPLPVGMLQRIPFRLSVDTIQLRNMYAQYEELSNKTNQAGSIAFTRLNASLFPVRNYDLQEQDSLRLLAEAWLLDSIPVRLRMHESYRDTLAGFLMNVELSPADLTLLNPVLEPMASIRLPSGHMDTLSFQAVGREHLSLGEMQFYYNNLKVQFLKDGKESRHTLFDGLISFIANHFVIRNRNTHRKGIIYFPRSRDRSIFNYWVKITLSGAASSVGVKNNNKMLRKYRKELKNRQLPPIHH